MKRDQNISYLLCAFLLGFFATLNQVILIREFLSVLYGNELILSLIFMMWFGGITVGAIKASHLRKTKFKNPFLPILLVAILPVIGVLQVYGVRVLRITWGIGSGQLVDFWQSLVSMGVIVIPFSFIVGMAFPLLSQAVENGEEKSPALSAGKIYWIESAGSLAGGVIFTYVFAGKVQAIRIEGLCMLVGSVLIYIYEITTNESKLKKILAILFLIASVFFIISGVFNKLDKNLSLKRWISIAPGFEFIKGHESRYQYLSVGHREGQFALYEDGMLVSVFPDPYEVSKPVHIYMNEKPGAKKVLLIGLGLEGEVQKILDYDVQRVVFVFIDAEYKTTVLPLLTPKDRAALSDPRLSIKITDPVQYFSNCTDKFDIIVLHPPPPSTAAYCRFYTKTFFERCKAHLAKDGIVAVSIQGAVNFIGSDVGRYTGTLYRTLTLVFPFVKVVPGTRWLFISSSSERFITLDSQVLAERFIKSKHKPDPYFTRYHFRLLLPPERVRWLNNALRNSPKNWINSEYRPIIYLYNLKLWNIFSSSNLGRLIDVLEKGSVFQFSLFLFAFLVVFISILRLKYRVWGGWQTSVSLWGIFVFGFSGMSIEIILLYDFQNIFGFLYSQIGLLVALFMLGLTFGAWITRRSICKKKKYVHQAAFIFITAFEIILSFAVGLTFGHYFSEWLICLEILIAGIFSGAFFPLACEIYSSINKEKTLKTSSRIDACDHFGALFGAALMGVVVMPVVGIWGAIAFIVVLLASLPVMGFLFY